jgi:hypothetical protein
MQKLINLYLSWFGSGFSPKAPGTMGTLASLPFIYAWSLLEPHHYLSISLIVILTLTAIYFTEQYQKKNHTHDPNGSSLMKSSECSSLGVLYRHTIPSYGPYALLPSAFLISLKFGPLAILTTGLRMAPEPS